ncbi:Predicted lipase [Burkholderia pseudomallei]|nr:Predicted lipase [Burkholderia pseudomallei]CAJ8197625.1 Predicted lipase [Burkholderia pseudomallei]
MKKFGEFVCTLMVFGCIALISACSTPGLTSASVSKDGTKGRYVDRPIHIDRSLSHFDPQEAKDMLEFCLDLDSQDDLMADMRAHPGKRREDSIYFLRPSMHWTRVYDSRTQVNAALDPTQNGFGPYRNAWTLWKYDTPNASGHAIFAIAIRGTVFSSKPSVKEDALTTTIPAQYGVEYPPGHYPALNFSGDMWRAEVHAGFAYGVFSLLFDAKYGVLVNLPAYVRPSDEIIVTGHSQGAAMATLVHAFLYQAMQQPANLAFHLEDRHYQLKSYGFAQPKPGNAQFAAAFAEMTMSTDNAFVLNNTLDPIPLLPPTVEFLADAMEDMPLSVNFFSRSVRALNRGFNWVRSTISEQVDYSVASHNAVNAEDIAFRSELAESEHSIEETRRQQPGAVSQNFVSAGYVIPLRGRPEGDYYDDSEVLVPTETDPFIQHHATTYRYLLAHAFPAELQQSSERDSGAQAREPENVGEGSDRGSFGGSTCLNTATGGC